MPTSPLAITIGAQAYSLKRVNQDNFGSSWTDKTTVAGTTVELFIKHAVEGKPKISPSGSGMVSSQMERHSIDLKVTVYDANGFPTVTQTYTHIRNRVGASVTPVADVVKALATHLNVSGQAAAYVGGDN